MWRRGGIDKKEAQTKNGLGVCIDMKEGDSKIWRGITSKALFV
jgi:hypothetical protein